MRNEPHAEILGIKFTPGSVDAFFIEFFIGCALIISIYIVLHWLFKIISSHIIKTNINPWMFLIILSVILANVARSLLAKHL
ncbi:hypothetical protein FEP08_03662 [Burkholderia multivorans]|nr:hypothetical protein [Burkholderia multivorans]PRD76280.1 hypothetical protein C6P75_07240 [Burkholderia multivorans]